MSLEPPEPQSDKDCEICEHWEQDLFREPCKSCWNCPARHAWKEKEVDEASDNGSEEVGGQNCGGCGKNMQ